MAVPSDNTLNFDDTMSLASRASRVSRATAMTSASHVTRKDKDNEIQLKIDKFKELASNGQGVKRLSVKQK